MVLCIGSLYAKWDSSGYLVSRIVASCSVFIVYVCHVDTSDIVLKMPG